MTFGENLKKIRKKARLTQTDIANCFGKDRSTYTCWETDRSSPSLDNVIKLSKIFDVSVADLICCGEKETAGEARKPVLSEPGTDPIAYLKKNEQLLILSFRLLDDEHKETACAMLRKYVEENTK